MHLGNRTASAYTSELLNTFSASPFSAVRVPHYPVDLSIVETIFHATFPLQLTFGIKELANLGPFYVLRHPTTITTTTINFSSMSYNPFDWNINAPRHSYLHLVLLNNATLAPFFSSALESSTHCVSFTLTGTSRTLHWHDLLGVLYDQHKQPGQIALRVHVQVVPKEQYPMELLAFHGLGTLEGTFLHSLKESDYMKYGSSKKMMTLSKPDTVQLWQGVVQNRLDMVEPILTKLLYADPLTRYWPLKIYYQQHVKQPGEPTQRFTHIRDVIAYLGGTRVTVEVQGLRLDPATPMAWVYRHLAAVDGWIYMFCTAEHEE